MTVPMLWLAGNGSGMTSPQNGIVAALIQYCGSSLIFLLLNSDFLAVCASGVPEVCRKITAGAYQR